MSDRRPAGAAGSATREVPTVWGNVPQRNKNFTGRGDLLTELRERVIGKPTAVLAHALHGMGGVGKTQLAVEYAYRYMGDYELIWWIPADQLALVRSSLAALAPRLGLEDISPTRVEDAVTAVLDALRRGEPYSRWLLIFDNADEPEDVRSLLPAGTGHVVVTSRNHRWEAVADTVEVDVFDRQESLDFLRRRVRGISESDATRLADELGDLPLALEQAGALQVEAGISVDEYLGLLDKEAKRVLAESRPTDYPVSVAAAWGLSVARLREQTPFAWELLCRLAFFGPEPIERDIFKQGRFVLGPPLQSEVSDPIVFSRAVRELGRYALARVDNYHKTLQVHRLIQRLIRAELKAGQALTMQHEVHLLLAATDPGDPDDPQSWPKYAQLLAHVIPSEAVNCQDAESRRLVRNMVQYLFNVGDYATCDDLSGQALERWAAESGPDDPDVLMLAGWRAGLLWARGAYPEAYELRLDTLRRMERVLGAQHEATLLVLNAHASDLRASGDFAGSLALDKRSLELCAQVLGDDDPRSFRFANNLAVSYALMGEYETALGINRSTHQDRLDFFGRDDHPWVVFSLGAIGRALRQAGYYAEALSTAEQAYTDFSDLVRQRVLVADHQWVLWQAKDLSVARRKLGALAEAHDLAEEVFARYVGSFGPRHPDTLAAAMNVGNARRVYGDVSQDAGLLDKADEQVEEAFRHYADVYGEDHPYRHGCALNLAIVRRRVGEVDEARRLLEEALAGLQRGLGETHVYSLICMSALATGLAETGETEAARDLGQRAFDELRTHLGADHPQTLACASNLAIDLGALGDTEAADGLQADTVDRYRRVLPEGHFDLIDAVGGERIAVDFEPPPI